MKYSLSPWENPGAPALGFPSCSGYISPYILPLIIIQIQYLIRINNDFQYVSVCLMSIPNAFFSRPVIGPAITCCTLYCTLHCSLYYTINLIQPSKWLANMPCFLRNTPHFMLPLSCTYHYTMYCNTPYTVHGTIHYIIHCTVHCTF